MEMGARFDLAWPARHGSDRGCFSSIACTAERESERSESLTGTDSSLRGHRLGQGGLQETIDRGAGGLGGLALKQVDGA